MRVRSAAPGAGAASARRSPLTRSRRASWPAVPVLALACAAGLATTHVVLRAQNTPAAAPVEGEAAQALETATRLTGVEVGSSADGITVTLRGNGRLAYSAIQQADRPPARLVVDLQGVRPDVALSTPGRGVVRRVRVALNNADPLVTRVVLDLTRIVSHRLRSSSDGREVVITLEAPPDTTAPDTTSAAAPAAPAASSGASGGAAPAASDPAPATERVATRLASIVLGQAPEGVTITLKGNGRLVPNPIEQAKDAPPRLVLDLPGVRPGVPAVTRVNQGVVDRVRVSLNRPRPAVTRVVLQMKGQFLYRMRVGQTDPSEVTITIADPQTQTEASPEFVLAEVVGAQAAAQMVARTSQPAPTPAASAPVPAAPALEPMEPVQLTVAGPGGQAFTGRPVSLDFQGVDLRAVLRTFSEITALNVVIDPGVKGTVDVSLREVPWDQALDIILRANQLSYIVEGSIVRIAPIDILAKEEQARRALKEERDLSGELKTFTRPLSYAKARELTPLLTKSGLTKRGTIDIDERTNTLIVRDLDAGLDRVRALIDSLDTAQPQVEIEARIIDTQAAFSKELGIRLGFDGALSPQFGNTLPVAFPNQATGTGRAGFEDPDAPNLISTTLKAINGAFSINAALSALETEGKVKVISAPRVIMQNNVEGEILQGTQIPYTTATGGFGDGGTIATLQVPTVQFKDAALKLTVKPQITAAGTIIMEIALERSAPNYVNALPGNPNPAIDTQRARTTIQVSDGTTALIGGVMFETNNSNDDRTPGLHKVPIIGRLFNRSRKASDTRELVLLITPKIVKG